jgi:hypothetical protein
MGAVRTTFALLAIGLGVGACAALQGLDKFDKCETDEECALVDGGRLDGTIPVDDGQADTSGGEAGCGDTLSSTSNCGRCGNACAPGFVCSAGTCSCMKTTCGGGTSAGDAGAEGGAEAGAEAGTPGPLVCVDTSADVNNCGFCDHACTFANAVPKCTTGNCALGSCSAGFVDCDGNAVNGCECPADSCLTAQKLCAKRVFITSLKYDGNLGGLAGADAKCQARAVAATLPGTYKAWLSDATGSPSTRFTKSTIPYRLVDGTLIANDFVDLTDGTVPGKVVKTETGGAPIRTGFCGPQDPMVPDRIMVWASTAANGTLGSVTGTCTNWSDIAVGGSQWADPASGSLVATCSGGNCTSTYASPLVCFQQ